MIKVKINSDSYELIPIMEQSDFDNLPDDLLESHADLVDLVVYSKENFEQLLEENFVIVTECMVLPKKFIHKETIDYAKMYFSKWFSLNKIKINGFYENKFGFDMVTTKLNSKQTEKKLKFIFHAVRQLYFAYLMIRDGTITNLECQKDLRSEIKHMHYIDNKSIDEIITHYDKTICMETKKKIFELVPNIITGIFEIHITIDCQTDEDMNLFLGICKGNGFKPIVIMLPSGENNRQVMTSSFVTGSYPDIKMNVDLIADNLFRKNGLEPRRIKIEALASNKGIPLTIAEKNLYPNTYFEFHHKILIKSTKEYQRLRVWARAEGAHLSSNAFKIESNELKHYFVTKRVYDTGKDIALQVNDYLIESLLKNGFTPLKTEREFVVYDSDLDYDKGWE